MSLTQQRADVKRLRECQLSISLEGVADRYEEVIDQLKRVEEDCRFLLSFVPDWAKIVPLGLDPTFYGTLTSEGDLAIKKRVDEIKAVIKDAKGEVKGERRWKT